MSLIEGVQHFQGVYFQDAKQRLKLVAVRGNLRDRLLLTRWRGDKVVGSTYPQLRSPPSEFWFQG